MNLIKKLDDLSPILTAYFQTQLSPKENDFFKINYQNFLKFSTRPPCFLLYQNNF